MSSLSSVRSSLNDVGPWVMVNGTNSSVINKPPTTSADAAPRVCHQLPNPRGQRSSSAGLTVTVGVPLGNYDETRLLNVGNNRWMLKTELGASHHIGKIWLEGAGAISLFTDNTQFQVTRTRSQDPIYSAQGHVVWEPRPRFWLSLDGTYFWGGQAQIDGVKSGQPLANSRGGLTSSLPIAARQSLKLSYVRGISTRTGANAQIFSVAWQYRKRWRVSAATAPIWIRRVRSGWRRSTSS